MNEDNRKLIAMYIRNFIFGVEDSLVSTVGLLSGIAIADIPVKTIILTGVVLIFVEAFSMAIGSFLSERSSAEYISGAGRTGRSTAIAGVIMFFSYFIAGFVPLSPYIFTNPQSAFTLSILFSLIALFILGGVSARFSKTSMFKTGMRMLLIGGIAIAVGVTVGKLIG